MGLLDDIPAPMPSGRREPRKSSDNFEELQNLGHRKQSEDFSDSAFADRKKPKCAVSYCDDEREVYAEGDHDTLGKYCAYHGEDADGVAEVQAIEQCEHQCISNCRREGCNCDCGEFHATISV